MIYKEFSKFGKLKRLSLNEEKHSAKITYSDYESYQQSIREMNYNYILKKEISVSKSYTKDELQGKKKFNLFLKNISEDLSNKVLHSFLQSTYGEIVCLFLR